MFYSGRTGGSVYRYLSYENFIRIDGGTYVIRGANALEGFIHCLLIHHVSCNHFLYTQRFKFRNMFSFMNKRPNFLSFR